MAGDDEDFVEELDEEVDLDDPEIDEEELEDDALDVDVLDDDVVETADEDLDDDEGGTPDRPAPAAKDADAEGDEDDDEDLVDPDDVEADLDTILKDRLVAADDEAEEDEEDVEVDDRGDPVDRIQPKRPGEFVCQSCFLVKHPSQLADETAMLCLDCV